jgi:hypothetical protein
VNATRTDSALDELVPDCIGAEDVVSLSEPVARRLEVASTQSRAAHLRAAISWLDRRPSCKLRVSGEAEVVYQAFLGPFLGFEGELGTLCSFACHLPFVLADLRATTILLLPILRCGTSRKKGRTGSPFAVSGHLELDPAVSGFAPNVAVDIVWAAMVAACRRVGVRLGMIVPLATISIDSPLIAERPDLVHWWTAHPTELLTGEPTDNEASSPTRPAWQVEAIPAADVLHRFTSPPSPEAVREIICGGDRLFVAEAASGQQISVANAYPDPVVADAATYSWQDVAAVRFADGVAPVEYGRASEMPPDRVNPVAADFVRDVLCRRLACDGGVLLADVSSAVPSDVLAECVPRYPETMLVAEQLWRFRDRGPFEFVSGPLIPCVAAHSRAPSVLARSLAHHLELLARTDDAGWFFAGVANHDSAPCSGRWARALLTLFCLLPRSVPFLYSGTEFGCRSATNMEFGEFGGLSRPADDELLLFSQAPVAVAVHKLERFQAFWCDLLDLREALGTARGDPSTITEVAQDALVVSARIGNVVAVINCDPSRAHLVNLKVEDIGEVPGVIGTEHVRRAHDAFVIEPVSTIVVVPRDSLQAVGSSFERAA